MGFDRGAVWWGPALHKASPAYRPWVIVSDDSHPFSETECIAVAMTTQEHEEGILVPDDAWIRGGSDEAAYVSPWYVTTIKQRDFDRQQGTLSESLLTDVVAKLHRYTPEVS